MLEEGLWYGREAHGPLLGLFSLPDAPPLAQAGMQIVEGSLTLRGEGTSSSSLHSDLPEASLFSHPHPGLGLVH